MATEMATESTPATAADTASLPAAASGTKRWYVVHAYSGMEKGVARALQERINRAGLQSQFGQILVPVEDPSVPPGEQGQGGRGRGAGGMGPGLRPPAGLPVTEGDESAGQLTWLVRAAQSLGLRTGLSLEYTRRSVFGAVPPVVVTTPPVLFEDGVYDDPYASDASAARAVLKHVFAGGATAEIGGHWLGKAYVSTVALDASGEPVPDGALRADTVWPAAASASMPALGPRTGPASLALELRWDYTRHRSNDAFYRYDAHAIGVGISAAY